LFIIPRVSRERGEERRTEKEKKSEKVLQHSFFLFWFLFRLICGGIKFIMTFYLTLPGNVGGKNVKMPQLWIAAEFGMKQKHDSSGGRDLHKLKRNIFFTVMSPVYLG
jgi:hypothetical protein